MTNSPCTHLQNLTKLKTQILQELSKFYFLQMFILDFDYGLRGLWVVGVNGLMSAQKLLQIFQFVHLFLNSSAYICAEAIHKQCQCTCTSLSVLDFCLGKPIYYCSFPDLHRYIIKCLSLNAEAWLWYKLTLLYKLTTWIRIQKF